MPALGDVHHLSLSVRDLARSTRWYCEVLGLEVDRQVQGHEFERSILRWPGGAPLLGLTRHYGNAGDLFSELTTGMDHVAFTVASPRELEEWVERLEVAGVGYSRPRPALVVLRDPDGIQLELAAR